VYIKSADGTGNQESLSPREGNQFGFDWSRDGKYLVASGGSDISYLRRNEDGAYEWVPFVVTEFDELSPDLSPDDTLVAFVSNESGRYEIYVQPFPDGGWKRQVSNNGGVHPRWRGDGKEMYYVEGDTLVAVAIERTPTFTIGVRTKLFSDETAFVGRGTRYDVAPDGKRFVVVETLKPPGPGRIQVVQNWYEPFRNREGAK
jgi:Tol biopolymer transport system component